MLSGGTITGPDYVINTSGIFIYSGTPANGNLIGSWAGAAGTDAFGNAYPQGFNISKGAISGTVFSGTDFILNSSGLFLYGGTPANGNLVASVAGGGGTDPFGNTYQAGITTYGGVGQFAALESGQVTFDNGSVIAEGAPTGSLWLIPTADLVIQPDNIEAAVFTKTSITLAQPVTATAGTASSPTLITTDTWNTMTLINGWTVGSGGFAQYKLMPDNTVMIRLNNVVPGTIADGTSIWTAPSGYVPSPTRSSRWSPRTQPPRPTGQCRSSTPTAARSRYSTCAAPSAISTPRTATHSTRRH